MPTLLYREFFIRKTELAADTQQIFYSFLNFKEVYFLHMVYNLINGFDYFGVILNTRNLKSLILRLWRFLLRRKRQNYFFSFQLF